DIFEGEVTALLGPNGSGKSTLMKVVAGILSMTRPGCSGQVEYKGTDFFSIASRLRAQRIAYVPADIRAEFPLTAYEAVSLGRTCQSWGLVSRNSQEDQVRIKWAMEHTCCWQLRERNLSTLSGGERQLVAIACALVQGAKILFLDESMSKMDLNHQALIGKMLRSLAGQGWSILLVCHDMNLASEWSDKGILLKEGKKIAQGTILETVTKEQLQVLYPGVDLVVGKSPASRAPKVFFGVSS
ncbi:MAG: ABC transporter ATP-binding protein, partial [Bdellovibrionia bacterium]